MVKPLAETASEKTPDTSDVDTGPVGGAAAVERQKESDFIEALEAEFNSGAGAEESAPGPKRSSRRSRRPNS